MTTGQHLAAEADRCFAAGLAAHEQGRLDDAFAAYEAALQHERGHFRALHHVAILGYQIGNYDLALEFIGAAITANPGVSSVYSDLGNILAAVGESDKALQSYEQALQLDQDNADALYSRGGVLAGLGRHQEALASYEAAIALAPGNAQAWDRCARALLALERPEQALAGCERAIALAPTADAWHTRGRILVRLGQAQPALASFEQALALEPEHVEARAGHAHVLRALGRAEEAIAGFDAALGLDAKLASAHHGRGQALRQLKRSEEGLASLQQAVILEPASAEYRISLGSVLQELGRPNGALQCFDAAIGLDGANPAAHNGRGIALQSLKRFDESLACFARVLELVPGHVDATLNRGNVLQDLGQHEAALACYDRVLALKGDNAEVWNNRGNVYEAMMRYEDALASYERAIAASPGYAVAHWNRGLLNLQHGRLGDGWRGYEWRWQNEYLSAYREKRNFVQPLWLGKEPLAGKTILLYAEQGLGDTLQFCRYAALVAARGARVVLEVQGSLAGLLARLDGVDQVVAKGDPLPPFDYQCPLMTLPLACGTELASIPAPGRYLAADAGRLAAWQARLGPRLRPRVGLVWSGNPHHANDHNRSLPFAQLARLFDLDCQFVSLQKEYRDTDRAALDACGAVVRVDQHLHDFSDTAALCELMDVVIAVDTSVAHLAGALGKPLWVLLPHVADWRWLTGRLDSPWYPGARLFRQSKAGDWEGVIGAVRQALEALPHP
jgi:tetratricopeptide (TPR) repeat protein